MQQAERMTNKFACFMVKNCLLGQESYSDLII